MYKRVCVCVCERESIEYAQLDSGQQECAAGRRVCVCVCVCVCVGDRERYAYIYIQFAHNLVKLCQKAIEFSKESSCNSL